MTLYSNIGISARCMIEKDLLPAYKFYWEFPLQLIGFNTSITLVL